MGKIVVCTLMTIDGYTMGKDGDLDQMPMDEAFLWHNDERARTASSFLFGANFYKQALEYWPAQHENPDAHPAERYIAERYASGIPITVVSDTLTPDDCGPWRAQTTIVKQADAHGAIAELRKDDGDALIYGCQTLWTDLLANGLVDELHLLIGAKILAGDRHAFSDVPMSDLRLIGLQTWADSDSVTLSYSTSAASKS